MALQFTWLELWSYHESLTDPTIKASLEQEILGDGWLYRQSAKEQEKVLASAPREFVEKIMGNLKPEVMIKMGYNPFLRR